MFDTEGTKYHPLFEHLLFNGHGRVTMSFAEIEAVLDARLPLSARRRQEWWSNSPNGHSQARAWMRAGYETSGVDLTGQMVTFTLKGWPERYSPPDRPRKVSGTGFAESPQAQLATGEKPHARPPADRDHPLFGIWKGKVKLLPGYDYTRPAFDADEKLDR
ncbi:MAG TPA: hypothetical protein VHA07_08455 [Devosia sp.]|nr:hypothetical protein [Devosia sp.]